jgi:hypothetical protein
MILLLKAEIDCSANKNDKHVKSAVIAPGTTRTADEGSTAIQVRWCNSELFVALFCDETSRSSIDDNDGTRESFLAVPPTVVNE